MLHYVLIHIGSLGAFYELISLTEEAPARSSPGLFFFHHIFLPTFFQKHVDFISKMALWRLHVSKSQICWKLSHVSSG
jgi:hypothetical protein